MGDVAGGHGMSVGRGLGHLVEDTLAGSLTWTPLPGYFRWPLAGADLPAERMDR